MDFKGFSTDDIADKTLQTLCFHIFATGYLKKGFLHFTDITDLELTTEPAVIDNLSQVVTFSEEKVVKKQNKYAAKRKERLAKLCALVRSPLSPYPKSSLFLSPYSLPASMPALVPTFVSAPFFRLRSLDALLSGCVPAPAAVSHCGISASLLPLLVLSPSLFFGPLTLRTFK